MSKMCACLDPNPNSRMQVQLYSTGSVLARARDRIYDAQNDAYSDDNSHSTASILSGEFIYALCT